MQASTSSSTSSSPAPLIGIVAGIVIAIGAFLPWAKETALGNSQTAAGFDGWEGKVCLIAGVGIAIGSFVAMRQGRARQIAAGLLIGGIIATGVAAYTAVTAEDQFHDALVSELVSQGIVPDEATADTAVQAAIDGGQVTVSISFGLYVVIFGGIAAVAAGATLSTHLGNAAHPVLRRHPNYIWEQLAEDRLTAGFIADGIHLDAAFLKTAIRAKSVDRSFLVTDASTPAGVAPGRYMLADQPVDLTNDGRVVLAGSDRLAGSALHMHRAVGNILGLAGVSLAEAVRMATVNPARAGKVAGRETALAAGATADITQFRVSPANDIEIVATWLAGEKVYSR